jgi:hypothetical protein
MARFALMGTPSSALQGAPRGKPPSRWPLKTSIFGLAGFVFPAHGMGRLPRTDMDSRMMGGRFPGHAPVQRQRSPLGSTRPSSCQNAESTSAC